MNKLLTLTLTILFLPLLAMSASATSDAASVEFTYSASSIQGGTLLLQGFAPEDAVSVSLRPHPVDTATPNSYPRICRPVTQGANPEFTGTFHPILDGWELESYMIRAVFYNDTGCQTGAGSQITPVAFGGVFDYLSIVSLQQQIEELLTLVNDTNSTLYAEISLLYNETITINTNLTTLQTSIDDLQAQINAMNHGTINTMYFDNDASWVAAQDSLRVWGEVPSGATSAEVFLRHTDQTVIDSETSVVITLGDNENSYEVFFQPISSYPTEPLQVLVKFYDASDNWMPGYDVGAMYLNNYLNYVDETLDVFALDIAQLQADVEAINETVENHTQQLSDIHNNLTAIWTELEYINDNLTALWDNATAQQEQINDLLARVTVLEAEVEAIWSLLATMNFGTINVLYYDEDASWSIAQDSVRVWGQAPVGAESAQVQMRFLDQTVFQTINTNVQTIGSNENQYQAFFKPVSSFPIAAYQVHVRFFDNTSSHMTGYDLGTNFDTLLNLWNEQQNLGFEHIGVQRFDVWNPQSSFTRPLTFAYTPQETAQYRFELETMYTRTGDDFFNTVVPGQEVVVVSDGFGLGCSSFDMLAHTKYNIVQNPTMIELLPEERDYIVKFRAINCGTGEEAHSMSFMISVNDLTNPWPEFGVNTTSLNPDVNNEAQGVFWTNNNLVALQGIFGSSTFWEPLAGTDKNCGLSTLSEDGHDSYPSAPLRDHVNYTCTWNNVDLYDGQYHSFGSEQTPHFRFSVCGNPNDGAVTCDDVTIGYDTTAPTIIEESLNPGVFDAVSGLWNFSANITDDGVIRFVRFEFVNKTNASERYPLGGNISAPTTGNMFVAQVSTTDIPDGFYNFSVYAEDYAGNNVTMMIDPIVDNTKPVISLVETPDAFLLGKEMSISVYASDNLAGITTVTGEVSMYVCNDDSTNTTFTFTAFTGETIVLTTSSGEIFNVSVEGDFSEEISPAVFEEDSDGRLAVPPMDFVGKFEYAGNTYVLEVFADESVIPTEMGVSPTGWLLSVSTEIELFTDLSIGDTFSLPGEESLVCDASQSCTNKTMMGEGPITVTFDLVSCEAQAVNGLGEELGTCLEGVWTTNIQEQVNMHFGEGMPDGVWLEMNVTATDLAGNKETYSTKDQEGPAGVDVNQGYDISITSVTPNPVTAGQTVTVQGTFGFSNNDTEGDGAVIFVNGVESTPVLMNAWTANVPASSAGTLNIEAVYTSACGQNFTATSSVTVDPAPAVRGGGGGGSGNVCNEGYERVDGVCTPVEQSLAPADPEPTGTTTTQEGTSGAGTTQEEDEEQPVTTTQEEETTDDGNLLTGAVVGGGFGAWGWLLAFAGLLLLLGGGYFFVRKK